MIAQESHRSIGDGSSSAAGKQVVQPAAKRGPGRKSAVPLCYMAFWLDQRRMAPLVSSTYLKLGPLAGMIRLSFLGGQAEALLRGET